MEVVTGPAWVLRGTDAPESGLYHGEAACGSMDALEIGSRVDACCVAVAKMLAITIHCVHLTSFTSICPTLSDPEMYS